MPTVVPPLEQFVGALAWGPNTLNVIVPPAELLALVNLEVIDPQKIAVPTVPFVGPPAVVVVLLALTTSDGMPLKHADPEA